METDLKKSIRVPFKKMHLDPNNPRFALEDAPGYDDDDRIFSDDIQNKLTDKVKSVYDVTNLERSMVAQGWVPTDSILVWEHPRRPRHCIVVEGNTRTVVLRLIRERLPKEGEEAPGDAEARGEVLGRRPGRAEALARQASPDCIGHRGTRRLSD